ncbi:cobalt-zinc-cadmium resistance protein CzcA [Sideroxyarcus emersonii]|uniref:Cobalt-zinc-cadmium resistance protein CzcA n=1 Tax=Sideroxyarcus emersonii TaxID=2764705 RepID=A0AAN2BY90_9PROT|nr:efflux RND transporter permease subunit [Sideroxyarcus emersonii]BCK86813.1 cobalt-zinc-cadmium resistance protein CzcA [Sideroxyarcus emersonii]
MPQLNLSKWAIRNRAIVLYLLLALLISGATAYLELPQNEDPAFTFKVMTVKVQWPGATAREVEQQVTDRIERMLQETPWLDNVSSISKPDEAVIFVTLKEGMPRSELRNAWATVRKKLWDMRRSLPDDAGRPIINDEFGDTYGSIYAFTSDVMSPAELEREASFARQELLKIANVDKVDLIGEQEEKIYIEFDSNKIAAFGIDPIRIATILKTQNAMEPAGEIVSHAEVMKLRVSGDFHSVRSIQDIGIPAAHGKVYRLGDISRVYRDYEDPPHFKMRYMGNEAVGLAISMTKNGNVIKLGKALDKAMAGIRTQLQPKGVEVHQVSDQPKVVKQAVSRFMKSLLEALLIVLAISFASLGWRAGMVVALSIPVVMAGTFLLMKLFGIDLQRVSIGALIIAIGLLVDDAMIAVEMMKVKLEQGWNKSSAAIFAYSSTAFPMLIGTLITAAAFLPVGLAKSSAGEYTISICIVVTISLLVSWLVAVVFTPYIGYRIMAEHPNVTEKLYQNWFYTRFRKLLVTCIEYRKTVIAATLLLFVLSLLGFAKVEQQFFPPSERTELLVDVWLPEGTAFSLTEGVTQEIEQKLKDDPNVSSYVSYIGGSTPRFYLPLDLQLPALNYAQIVITTRDLQAREAELKKLRNILDSEYAALGIRVSRLENGPPVGYPVQFRIIGQELDKVHEIADQVLQTVKQSPDTKNVSQDSSEPIKTIDIELDQGKARALGISSQALSRYLQMLHSGISVTQYREGDKRIEVVMRAEEEDRRSETFLKHVRIPTANGKFVPLSDIATLSEHTEEGIVWRLNRMPVVTVRADVTDNVQASEVSHAIEQKLDLLRASLPSGYRIETGGADEDSDKATESIIAVLPLMSFIILTLLMWQLRQFRLVALVLLTAPLGLIGVSAALLAFHVPFGFVAMLGMISLAGMIMRNSVILVDQIEQDIKLGLSRYAAIVDSTVRRARPIVLTAAAAILAMIPLTTSVFWGPMAIVIMGGLFVATLLTLLFLPALYAAWFNVKRE